MFEELFYNSEFKKFRVVCIDQPLTGTPKSAGTKANGSPQSVVNTLNIPPFQKRTLDECVKFLCKFPENTLVLKKIEEYISNFCNTYFIVKGFEHHARRKVEELVERAAEVIFLVHT